MTFSRELALASLSALLLGGAVIPAAQAAPCIDMTILDVTLNKAGNYNCSLGGINYRFADGTELGVVGTPQPRVAVEDHGITSNTDASGLTRYFLHHTVKLTNMAFGASEFSTQGFAVWGISAMPADNSEWYANPTDSVATWSWTSWVPSSVAGSSAPTTVPSTNAIISYEYFFSAQGAKVRPPAVISTLPSSMSAFNYTLIDIPAPTAGFATTASAPVLVPAVVGSGSGYNSSPSMMRNIVVEAIDATGWGRRVGLPAWFPGTPASGPGYNTVPGKLRVAYDQTLGLFQETLLTSGVNPPGEAYVGNGSPGSNLFAGPLGFYWYPTWIPRDPNAPFERLTFDELADRGETTGRNWIAEQVLNSVSIDYVWMTGTRPAGYVDPSVDVPEPSTFGLALMALGGIVLARHRRRALAETGGCPHVREIFLRGTIQGMPSREGNIPPRNNSSQSRQPLHHRP